MCPVNKPWAERTGRAQIFSQRSAQRRNEYTKICDTDTIHINSDRHTVDMMEWGKRGTRRIISEGCCEARRKSNERIDVEDLGCLQP